MAIGIDRVGKGVDCAQRAGASLQMIVAGTREVAGQIQSIASAAEKQATTAREISTSINSIGSIQEAADDGARHTKAAIASLIAESSEVKNRLGQFKIAGGAQIANRGAPRADMARSVETPRPAAAGESPRVD